MKRIIMLIVLMAAVTGCTLLPAPDRGLMDRVPVATLDDKAPAKLGEYILRIPAGHKVPIKLHLKGGLFQHNQDIEADVRFTRDLYLYKYWGSFDGRDWEKWSKLVKTALKAGVDTSGATVTITLNTIK